jgi:hypothetical protein
MALLDPALPPAPAFALGAVLPAAEPEGVPPEPAPAMTPPPPSPAVLAVLPAGGAVLGTPAIDMAGAWLGSLRASSLQPQPNIVAQTARTQLRLMPEL